MSPHYGALLITALMVKPVYPVILCPSEKGALFTKFSDHTQPAMK